MPGGVYLLCAATSFLCMVMLARGYVRSRVPLLFWSSLCFLGLAIDNTLLYLDLVIFPSVDLSIWRRMPGLVALLLLIYGLVFDSK